MCANILSNFQTLLGRLRSRDSKEKRHFCRQLSRPGKVDRLHQLSGQKRHGLHGIFRVEIRRPGEILRVQYGNEGM